MLARPSAALVAVLAGVESALVASRATGTPVLSATTLATVGSGWMVVVCGMLAVNRRTAVGLLLGLTGLAWLAASWDEPTTDGAVIFTVGLLVATAYPVLLAHTCLLSVTERLGLLRRLALAIGYVCTLVLAGLVPALLFDPPAQSCYGCPGNLVRIASSSSLFGVATRAGVLAGVVWSLALSVTIVVTLVRSSRTRRIPSAVLSLPTLVLLVAVCVDYVHSAPRGYLSDDAMDQRLSMVQAIAIAAAALGTLWPELQRLLVRRKLTRLVIEVAEAPRSGQLAERLGSVIGDSDVRVLYPLADGRITDARGDAAGPAVGQVTTPLVRGGHVVALLTHQPGLLDAAGVPSEIARSAALVLDNERLQAEARSRLADVRASRARIVQRADAERLRLERDLHDGAQQRLVTLSLGLRVAMLRTGGGDAELRRAMDEVAAALVDLRRLAHGIFPRELADEGLAAALGSLAEGAHEEIDLRCVPVTRFDARVESAAFFAVAFLTRSGRSAASVSVVRDTDQVRIDVAMPDPPTDLTSLEDRVRAVDGIIWRDDAALHLELPCAS